MIDLTKIRTALAYYRAHPHPAPLYPAVRVIVEEAERVVELLERERKEERDGLPY